MINQDISFMPATELARQFASKTLSPVEVMETHLRRVEQVNPKLNAIVVLCPDEAMDRAREAEKALMRGESWGPLHGVPFTIKDCIDNKGVLNTRGSKLYEDFYPEEDAVAVKRLLGAGGIFIGKTNMPELAFWWETGNLVYGFTENPWMKGRTAGGSSGGEASAIAAGLSFLGLGSDVGGSIRQPASFCGIVGLKATHGRIPLTGSSPETLSRFMHIGPMARTVRDVALALQVTCGPDDYDYYAVPVPTPSFDNLDAPLPPLRVGFCPAGPFTPVSSEVQATVRNAAKALSDAGCVVEEVSLDHWKEMQAQDISMSYFLGEGAYDLDPLYKGREHLLAPSMQRRLAQPRPTVDAYYKSLRDTERLRADMKGFFRKYDLLLTITTPVSAFPHDHLEIDIDGQKVPGRNSLRATVPFDLTGSPAVSLPFGWSSEGLPLAVQLVGRHFDESTLLHAAATLEAMRPGADRKPIL